jgi:hypothetical protein
MLLIVATTGCTSTKVLQPYKYIIYYLESSTVTYTDVIPKSYSDYKEDADVFKLHNGKYIKILSVYE